MFEIAGRPPPPVGEGPPARFWRVLAWRTQSGVGWDVERLVFEFDDGAEARPFESGSASPEYGVRNAFEDVPGAIWGGRPEEVPGGRPAYFAGVELSAPAIPKRIAVAQCAGAHATRAVLVQWSLDGREWRTSHVAPLGADGSERIVYHRPADAPPAARHWRLATRETEAGFCWDVQRLRFLWGNAEQAGAPISSGFALEGDCDDYAAKNAFEDTSRYWGGRVDADGVFHLGIRADAPVPVDRILIEHRGADRMAHGVEVQRSDDGSRWRTVRHYGSLRPGLNDLLLLEPVQAPRWMPPRLLSTARHD
jgi:hypothetical protein